MHSVFVYHVPQATQFTLTERLVTYIDAIVSTKVKTIRVELVVGSEARGSLVVAVQKRILTHVHHGLAHLSAQLATSCGKNAHLFHVAETSTRSHNLVFQSIFSHLFKETMQHACAIFRNRFAVVDK